MTTILQSKRCPLEDPAPDGKYLGLSGINHAANIAILHLDGTNLIRIEHITITHFFILLRQYAFLRFILMS